MSDPNPTPSSPPDPELSRIVGEEEASLARVLEHLARRATAPAADRARADYDAELLSLRDQIAVARTEDIPPLLEQMERLQGLAARRREIVPQHVDGRSPYFGRLVLAEQGRKREVLIGRSTYLDTKDGVRIVDWRDAPVSRLFYRYEEGDEYDEVFGEKEVTGEVMLRRSVTIVDAGLRRIGSPQGSFARSPRSGWRRLDEGSAHLRGGAGAALRASEHRPPGKLGTGEIDDREDKHLREITALIDPRQFELITQPDSGLVVIQGGAGSGKTTIGLHRLAWLAFHDRRRFRPERMLVVVFNDALARYVSLVLPALEVQGVAIRTYLGWAAKARLGHLPRTPRETRDDTPSEVTRLKKHPAMLRAIELLVERAAAQTRAGLAALGEPAAPLLASWDSGGERPLAHRLHAIATAAREPRAAIAPSVRSSAERLAEAGLARAADVIGAWADLLTDRALLAEALAGHPHALTEAELTRAHSWCTARVAEVVGELERRAEAAEERQAELAERRAAAGADDVAGDEPSREEVEPRASVVRRAASSDEADEEHDREGPAWDEGADGRDLEERAKLDPEDDTLLLRLVQRLRGPLLETGKGARPKTVLQYEHVLIDEAQDLSPVELAVVLDTVRGRSVTLAGDVAQRLHMDNGFYGWHSLLGELGLSHVEIEPLRLSYRSTAEIVELARAVLGPLAPADSPVATRRGAPVELFGFAHTGDAVGFVSEALRELMAAEPRASVAVVARYPEQADLWFTGLRQGEVPYLRRVAAQDFSFRPGIDVTDVRQVKGLEFDYVLLVEANDSSYPLDDESRHLLHIGATRAAHQLWIVATGRPSLVFPDELRERAL
ncbi:MAG: ATP-binding domain-containing protein [Polyangiaceae bacterium]|nr:ATP-binding domain-containing protein [Polyangiaceae bacterium]